MVGVKYVASCSFGKDSLAMVLRLLEESWKLDEVVFYDTGMEFQAIYDIRDQVKKILERRGIEFMELKPRNPFLYDMTEREVHKRDGRIQKGYGWCGGACRWGTANKVQAIQSHFKGVELTMYVGIAIDEPKRLARLEPWKTSPLATWGMTEVECLQYCRERGFTWKENGVCLYDLLDRVSCWCCRNKNQKELKNIYLNLPEYWQKLVELQDKIGHNMKHYKTHKVYGDLGNLHNLQKMWEEENKQITLEQFLRQDT